MAKLWLKNACMNTEKEKWKEERMEERMLVWLESQTI